MAYFGPAHMDATAAVWGLMAARGASGLSDGAEVGPQPDGEERVGRQRGCGRVVVCVWGAFWLRTAQG
jgi:hypothetical protein